MNVAARTVAFVCVVVTAACTVGSEEASRTGSDGLTEDRSITGRVSGTGGMGLRLRAEPSTSSKTLDVLADGVTLKIACQTRGEAVRGNDVWNFVEALGGYLSDSYVVTGYDGFHPDASRCDAGSTSGASRGKDEPPVAPGKPKAGNLAGVQAAIDEARVHLGYGGDGALCNKFSSYWGGSPICRAWCSDFVRYVWMSGGFDVDGITPYSGTVYDYGVANKTVRTDRYTADVAPGDAILWGAIGGYSAHVAMVTKVYSDGTLDVIHGNYANAVFEGRIGRDDQAGTDYPIYAFVSPVRSSAR